ncbi:hypothetical protein AAFF_G00219960 [Aldrovandia affinis]|uniref:Uncharacterized protein n=1 Tax=Aldrovandia affinis TaxID=143900 RepID=A0AAD7RFZ7_9TELE|nr:hypothetical protein AAFF_G00219960 [Aldrovandia affinis]
MLPFPISQRAGSSLSSSPGYPFFSGPRTLSFFPPSAPALDSLQVSAPVGEDSIGGEEVAVPVVSSPEMFSPLSGTVAAESGEGAPFLEEMALLTTMDLATSAEWGGPPSLAGEGMAEWVTTPSRKRASSGDHECPRDIKSAPSIPLGNRYEVLAGSEVGVDMDVELSSFLDGWAMDNLMEARGWTRPHLEQRTSI